MVQKRYGQRRVLEDERKRLRSPKVEIETDTPEPPTPETTEPVEVPPYLPHTGQVYWPIPVLALAGIVLVLTGLFIRRRKSRDA